MRRYGKTHCAAALFGASALLAACQEDETPPEGTAAAADEAVTDVHIPLGKTKPGCSYVFGFERAFNN